MRKIRSAFFIWPACAYLFRRARDFLLPYVLRILFMAYPLRRSPRHQGEPTALKRFWRRDEPRSTESFSIPMGFAAMHRRLPAGRVGCSPIPKSLIQAAAVRHSAAKPRASRDNCRRSMSEHIAASSAAAAASGYFMSQTLSSVPDRPLCQRQHRMGRRVGCEAAKRRIE
jgi:hypothetical protein